MTKEPKNTNGAETAYHYAKQALQEKYRKEFEIEDLERKYGGVFSSKEYIGVAYPVDSTGDRFTVWVDLKEKQVMESFACVQINQIACAWVDGIACEIWEDSDAQLQSLMVSKPVNALSTYQEGNIEDYFREEFSNNKILLRIQTYGGEEAEIRNISAFLEKTDCVTNGLLYITYSDTDRTELAVSLAADEDDVRAAIADWVVENGKHQ